MAFSACCPAGLRRLSLVVMLSCSSGLIAFGSVIGTSGVATARGAASPLSTAQPCEWQVSVPLRASADVSSATFVTLDRRASASAHPTLAVSPTSKAIGGTVAIVGRQFNRSFGPITIHATIPESDMLFEVHGTTRIRVDAAGSFTSHLYLPYQIPAGHATLYAEQGGQVVAQTGFRVTAAVTSPLH